MAEYGIPYQGSKAKIIYQFAHLFPKADHFYDLFGGGFSVTHFMLQRRVNHFKTFHFNEIRPGICDLIKKAISGEYNYSRFKMPWVSREEFKKKYETDPFIKTIWSFGNDGKTYLFGESVEPYKKALHNCVVFDQFDELARTVTGLNEWPKGIGIKNKRLFIRNRIEWFRKTKNIPEIVQKYLKKEHFQQLQQLLPLDQLERLQQLQQLERLQRLEQLQRLAKLTFYNLDYRKVPITPNCVIYCDIPYLGTTGYGSVFSHKDFYEWADAQNKPVFISEYSMPDKRFTLIKKMTCRSRRGCQGGVKKEVECVYVNKAGLKKMNTQTSAQSESSSTLTGQGENFGSAQEDVA